MSIQHNVSFQNALRSWQGLLAAMRHLCADSADFPAEVEGLSGSLSGFFTAELARCRMRSRMERDMLVVVPTEREAADLRGDIESYAPETEVLVMPWWGTVPYRAVARGSIVFGRRAGFLSGLLEKKASGAGPRVFIATQRAFMSPLPPPEYERSLLLCVRKGAECDTEELAGRLSGMGYTRVPRVTVAGEFTLRGEVLDIFLPCGQCAHRISFDFDTVSRIRLFDPETQSTVHGEDGLPLSFDSLHVYPMKEVLWGDELVARLEGRLSSGMVGDDAGLGARVEFSGRAGEAALRLCDELRTLGSSEGEEFFYGALWGRRFSLLDYITDGTMVIFHDWDRLANSQESIDREYAGMYRRAAQEFPVLPPGEALLRFEELASLHGRCVRLRTLHTALDEDALPEERNARSPAIRLDAEPSRSFMGNIGYLREQLASMRRDGWRVFVFADGENQALRIGEILRDLTDAESYPVQVLPLSISAGFAVPDIRLLVIQENEIFGRRRRAPASIRKARSAAIDTFVELNPGDFVVHANYGIGRFECIERVRSMGVERDYIKLMYADEEICFIPIEQVNLVQRYIGSEGIPPRLDRIGGKSWESRKSRVQKAVEELARRLIDLYSKRKAARGFPFPRDTDAQAAFEAAFPYEDTPDQAAVSREIKADMERPVPMDRLLCGDVGYGKTELAMRAAFKAVFGGKQVAFLAPTTILAEQHYDTCVERFRNFPVIIRQLSRFVPRAEQKRVLADLAEGKVDILVGTHRIIQKDVAFRDLGLIIIDEEQRFGVKDKERLKVMKTSVDSLSMSATPIPRTLHMSLLKIRDMSLLTTPPHNRQPIETVIDSYDEDKVARAVRREVDRGGQVFFLHNRVESLEEVRHRLQGLLPEMMIDVAHGQMSAEELDDIFRRFKMGGFHVLIATTIIENGIDIPNVNTIIIDRADMYGVSQLYQLRGRVGRSDRKAYAYLFYPGSKALSDVAMKRLQVISDFTELGSGFKIAMKDMEIRGAGNLLGRDQSGEVCAVGFEMYLSLLESAVRRLTESGWTDTADVLLELEYTGFIPENYVRSPQTKMEIYKKIAAVQSKRQLESLHAELEDRFGAVPDEVHSLLSLAEIRIICRRLGITVLREKSGTVRAEFGRVADVNIDRLLRLVSESGGRVRLSPAQPNVLLLQTGMIGLKEKSEFIREKLELLA